MAGIFDFLSSPSGQAATAEAAVAVSSGDFSSAGAVLGRAGVQGVTFRTQISPPITVSPFAETPTAGPPNPLLSFLKPQVEVDTPGGRIVVAPYGEPTANYFPWLAIGVVVFGMGVVALIGWIARRL